MRASTAGFHRQLEELGRALGFDVRREVSDSVLSLRLDRAYTPRVDLLWSVELSPAQSRAIACVTGAQVEELTHLPVVGIEVEGTTPTTKTMAADIANIAALGTRLGLLVVSEEGERGIYGRAARAIRSVRRSFGDLVVVPVEASWLGGFAAGSWDSSAAPIAPRPVRGPAGGESLKWSASTRQRLRQLGEDAGFVVVEPYVPEVLSAAFHAEQARRRHPLRHLIDPVGKKIAAMKKAADFLTECQVDLAWLLPLPRGLRDFLAALVDHDPCSLENGLVFPELHGHVAVVGFELESSSGKHAAGGLLNLSAYCVVGIGVVPDARRGGELEDILARYRPTLGLRNVRVLVHA